MKKYILLLGLFGATLFMGACNKQTTEEIKTIEINQVEIAQETEKEEKEIKSKISGSFSVNVLNVILDYSFDATTPNIALVSEFQSYPFTMFVGEEIAEQLKVGEVYVFTIKPIEVNETKEYLESLCLSSLVWELYDFEITDVRLANENEIGLESLRLTIE